jgi:hypothetical protein
VGNQGISPLYHAAIRSGGARPPRLGVVLGARHPRAPSRRHRRLRRHDCALFALEFVCIYWGFMFTTRGCAGCCFIYATPFFVALGAHWLFPAERLSGAKVAGLVAAFAGLRSRSADGLRLPTHREILGGRPPARGGRPLGHDDPDHQGAGASHQPAPDAVLPARRLGGAPRARSRHSPVRRASRGSRGRVVVAALYQIIARGLRQLPRVVLDAHPLSGVGAPRLHVLDASLRASRGLAPAERAG